MNDLIPLALAFAPPRQRDLMRALFHLDAALGRIVSTTTEPLVGHMRLTWWHDRLCALDRGEVPAEPVLAALSPFAADGSVTGAALAKMVEGWEALLEPMPLDDAALRVFGEGRGDRLFKILARTVGENVAPGLGAGWALVDFAIHCSDEESSERAAKLAHEYLRDARIGGPKPLRILASIAGSKALQPPRQIHEPIKRGSILRAVLR